MPAVTKQKMTPTPKPGGNGLMGRIKSVDELQTGIKLNVYGRGKTGKTRLSCTFPKPLLILGTEDGTKSVIGVKGVKYVRLAVSTELDEVPGIVGDQGFRTVVLDTAGGLQDLILKEILGLAEVPINKSWGMAQQKDWQICTAQFRERMSRLINLADMSGTHVVIIAHERNFTNEDIGSDVMMPSVGSALTPTAASWLNGACDYVCNTFIREQTTTRMVEAVKGKSVEVKEKTGKEEFCLRIGPHPIYMTGFRLPPGRELPDVIVDPSYAKIADLIKGG